MIRIKSRLVLYKILVIGIVILFQLCPIYGQENYAHFVPQPESISYSEGVFVLHHDTKVILPPEHYDELKPYLEEKFRSDLGFVPMISQGSNQKNNIVFKLETDVDLTMEGYHLVVTSDHVIISAQDYGGLFNGFQTLRQTFPINVGQRIEIPALTITDNPRFRWRGLMLDVSRHFQSKEFVLKQIDVLSSYKINKFHWHLTDDQGWRIQIDQYPNLTTKGAWRADRTGVTWWNRDHATTEEPKTVGGFYTKEDIKEVIAYAKIRNVEVIPEIDIPGHSKALVASYPHLFCYDEPKANFEVAVGGKAPDNAVCAGKETTYTFLENVIEEIVDLFPSQYLHIGGDECNKSNWKKCPHCQKVKTEFRLEDEEELQSYFIKRVHKIVSAQGKAMIGWDEILSGGGAPGSTIMAWRRGKYTPQITAPQEGYSTIMTSYKYSYISQVQGSSITEPEGPKVVLPLSKVYGHEPIPAELTVEQVELVVGNQVSLWGEFTPTEEHCEYMLYPRSLASAEVSWSKPEVKDWKRFQKAMESYHFEALRAKGVIASQSMYSVYPAYAIDQLHSEAIVYLETETFGHHIYYTLDGTNPSTESTLYNGAFRTAHRSLLKAGLFDENGKLLGNILELRLK